MDHRSNYYMDLYSLCRSFSGAGRWVSATFLTWDKIHCFLLFNSHLQLILELVIVLCVASTLECNSRLQNKTIRFSVFSKCLEASTLTLPPPKHCPSLCDTGTMSPQCILPSAAAGSVPAHLTFWSRNRKAQRRPS